MFISSASAYQKPPTQLPVTESTPLRNPFWQYSRDKIACEDLLVGRTASADSRSRSSGRRTRTTTPSGRTLGGWTDIARMRAGKPVIVHGDGTSLWTITHSDDFAVAFTGLLGNPAAVGEAFHITGTHAPTWNQIYGWLADAAGVASPELVHVASETIARMSPDLGPGLVGDKAHSMVFDNAQGAGARTRVPYDRSRSTRARAASCRTTTRIPATQHVDEELDALSDRLAAFALTADGAAPGAPRSQVRHSPSIASS